MSTLPNVNKVIADVYASLKDASEHQTKLASDPQYVVALAQDLVKLAASLRAPSNPPVEYQEIEKLAALLKERKWA